jgi:ESS family glutamate:Na+ symporter
MILAGISAIEFEHLTGLWLPILLLSIGGTVVTFVYLAFICKRLYPEYRYEAFASLFGMLTGTASTGTILLREVDPQFETPASNNLIMQTVPAIAFGFPILLLVGFAPQSLAHSLITMAIISVLFVGFNLFIIGKRKKKMTAPLDG